MSSPGGADIDDIADSYALFPSYHIYLSLTRMFPLARNAYHSIFSEGTKSHSQDVNM